MKAKLTCLLILVTAHAVAGEIQFVVLTNGRTLAATTVDQKGGRLRIELREGGEMTLPLRFLARIDSEGAEPEQPDSPRPSWWVAMEKHARSNRLDVRLVYAVAKAESNLDERAVSPRGALGLMQLMPGTASELGIEDPFDPVQSIDGGCRYLRRMLDRFGGDRKRALAAYNAGPELVARNAPWPRETRRYVDKILSSLAAP